MSEEPRADRGRKSPAVTFLLKAADRAGRRAMSPVTAAVSGTSAALGVAHFTGDIPAIGAWSFPAVVVGAAGVVAVVRDWFVPAQFPSRVWATIGCVLAANAALWGAFFLLAR